MEFARFMSGMWGRGIRIVAGLGLVYWSYNISGAWMYILAIVGAVVFIAGAMNFCIFAPLFGGPFLGKNVK